MKTKLYIIYYFLVQSYLANCQNLINNPSFENYINCPGIGPISSTADLGQCTNNWNINNFPLSAGYFNSCDTTNPNVGCLPLLWGVPYKHGSFQYSHSGNAHCGFQTIYPPTNLRFGINKEINSLVNNAIYDLSFYINSADHVYYFCNNLQAYFTIGQIPIHTAWGVGVTTLDSITPSIDFKELGYQITDTLNWIELKGRYKAIGGEDFFTITNLQKQNLDTLINIGGFQNDTCGYSFRQAYIYIDDVSLTLGIDAGKDTIICTASNKSMQLKASAGWQHYQWYLQGNTNVIDTGRAINISTPGTYIVKGTVDSLPNYFKADTIVVGEYNLPQEFFSTRAPDDVTVCPSVPVNLLALNTSQLFNYLWSNNNNAILSNSPNVNVTDSGTYYLKISSGACYKTDSAKVNYYSNQQSLIDSNTIHISNLQNTITANSGFTNYEWSSGEKTQSISIQNSKFKIQNFSVVAKNSEGCLVNDSVEVVYRELPIIVPNPQTIQKGNTFQIINLPNNSNVYLYDALGKIVFEVQNYHVGSNAPLVDLEVEGIYYYMIVMPDGQIQKGKVNFVRD